MNDRQATDWNPVDPTVLSDQRSAYDAMRERCPVAYSNVLGWSLFRHKDILDVLGDPETYSSVSRHLAIPNGMDPPQHTLYRRALEPYFAGERMAEFEPQCRRIAGDLVQSGLLNNANEIEFVTEFAEPFPLQVLCEFLGWSPKTWEHLLGWTHGNQQAAFSGDREMARALARIFAGFVDDALESRRSGVDDKRDDLTTSLMNVEVAGGRLSDEDIVSILRNWTAGQGTVAAALSILMLHLAEHADIQQRLRREPALLPVAIDEILRADGPLVANRRTTTRDVEIGDRTIAAGEKISLIWIAANRDEQEFDDPQEVRIDRDQHNNLLFGQGIHDCIGASLARLELRVALEELLASTTSITLSDSEPPRRTNYPSNGLQSMMIRIN